MVGAARVAVLISGRGSNMLALHDRIAEDGIAARIVGVATDSEHAAGIELAAERGLPTAVVDRARYDDRRAHEVAMSEVLTGWSPDYVCLAGYMRILSAAFLERWQGQVLNIHPSLLPAFPGLDTHQRALDAGVCVHGCTVHFVTPGVDEGPIIAQAAVPVRADDDAETLAARVLREEHRLYARALADVTCGTVRLQAGRVVRRQGSGAVLQVE